MISSLELRGLLEYSVNPESPVLTVYLNVDQSNASNLNRGFEATLKNELRGIEEKLQDKGMRRDFSADVEALLNFVSSYQPKKRTLVAFSDASEKYLWCREISVPLNSCAHWEPTLHVRPLLEAFDEFERYGVLLADKNRARLFTMFLNQIEEHLDAFAQAEVKHIKGPGSDHGRSQAQLQRKAEEHAMRHLKNSAELMDVLADEYHFDHLVLAGPVTATTELQHLLPERLRRRVVGVVALSMEATEGEVLAETIKVQKEVERQKEENMVSDLVTAAAKNNHAVTGLDATLQSLSEGRVWHLLFSDGFVPRGGECPRCTVLVGEGRNDCPYCGGEVKPVHDLIERAAWKVIDSGGRYEHVRERAAERLNAVGGVGAFLRF